MTEPEPRSRLARAYATVVSVAFAVLVLAPGIPWSGEKNPDGFPFSTYPMFRGDRPALERLTYAVAVDAEGERHALPTSWWTSGGMNEGRDQILDAVKRPDRGASLCARIAERLAGQKRGWSSRAVEVRILRGKWSRERYFLGDGRPEEEKTVVTCPVTRS